MYSEPREPSSRAHSQRWSSECHTGRQRDAWPRPRHGLVPLLEMLQMAWVRAPMGSTVPEEGPKIQFRGLEVGQHVREHRVLGQVVDRTVNFDVQCSK